jgi:phosphoheptose isomerase
MFLFPDRVYEDAGSYGAEYFEQVAKALASIDRNQLNRAAKIIEETIASGGVIYSCGNGGSAAIANHLACDCLKGIRTDTSLEPRVVSLSATVELITAIANDISYAEIFSYQLAALARPGDALIAISSSGRSPNIVNALTWARATGVSSIAMTGFEGGAAATTAEVCLHVDAHNYGIVEDAHQSLMHLLAQYVRHRNLSDRSMLGRRKF